MSKSDINLDKIVSDFKKIAKSSNEEELRTNAKTIIENITSVFGLKMETFEYSLVSGARAESLYSHVLIEYKAPGILSNAEGVTKAREQIISYIVTEAGFKEKFKYFGIIISDMIAFVKFDTLSDEWVVRGPYEINKEVVLKMVVALRGLTRKRLCAEELLKDFGPESEVASTAIAVFYHTFNSTNNPKINLFFEGWRRIFLQITGYKKEDLQELDKFYAGKDCEKLLFCIHTYYALLIKILAAELAYLYGAGRYLKSYVNELEDEYSKAKIEEFRNSIKDLEEGSLFKALLKIRNFIEGGYFSWYLEEFDKDLMDIIAEIARKLSDYEPATPVLEPEKTKDMLKILYQELVPRPIRHNLGEYYTPDWLAQFLLDRVNFTVDSFVNLAENDPVNPLQLQLLDPSCGSGTFLIEALKRLRLYAEDKCITDVMAEHVFENIFGIDCNPLAVLASKTNYLLIIGDLIGHTCNTELPVYCADPIRERPALLKFDYVVGNPPWVLWDHLPVNYRRNTQELWKDYGLFTLPASQARHGGGKKDISILFTYVCADRYLKDSGTFGFLITQSVFKTKGAGEGFRKFTLKDTTVKVVEAHDFVDVKPFEANNRTAAIILEKGGKTVYPVAYMVWRTLSDIDQKESLETASKKLQSIEMAAIPSDCNNELSPWITVPRNAVSIVQKVCGKNEYPVYSGISSGGANSVYWIKILDVVSQPKKTIDIPLSLRRILNTDNIFVKELLVENVTGGMKRKVKKVKTVLEDFFIYPLLKSKNVRKWKINGYNYALQMQDPVKRVGFNEEWVKATFPETYNYLKNFEEELSMRKSSVIKQLLQRGPFYTMYAVGEYTYAPYKVVWNRMGSKITACVISTLLDPYLGEKPVLPENVLAFIPVDDEDEAYYICSIMNSSITDMILRSIAGGTKSFGTPKIVEDTIKIPLYDTSNELHKRLSEFSRKAHENAQKNEDISKIEEEIDGSVSELYGISEKSLQTVKKILLIQEGETPEEDILPGSDS